MSGLEVVALVAGISAAFTGAAQLHRTWKDSRRDRRNKRENQQLQQLVSTGGPRVQQAYDDNFRRMGESFARGDRKSRLSDQS